MPVEHVDPDTPLPVSLIDEINHQTEVDNHSLFIGHYKWIAGVERV
jgi:hypothetical protein